MKDKIIAIIGGGYSGTILAVQLLQLATTIPLRVYLIDKAGSKGLGMAYATTDSEHILNVPAANMGAFADAPQHFYQWLQKQSHDFGPNDFVPRRLYGEYLQETGQQAVNSLSNHHHLYVVSEEAVQLQEKGQQTKVIFASGKSIQCHKVVLALGNFLPANLRLADNSYQKDYRYFRNPWDAKAFEYLRPLDHV